MPGTLAEFINAFRREEGGAWLCVKPAVLDLPHGPIHVAPGTRLTSGTKFMNVDLVNLLEAQYEMEQVPQKRQQQP